VPLLARLEFYLSLSKNKILDYLDIASKQAIKTMPPTTIVNTHSKIFRIFSIIMRPAVCQRFLAVKPVVKIRTMVGFLHDRPKGQYLNAHALAGRHRDSERHWRSTAAQQLPRRVFVH
jgi:hypothetical protein